MHDVLARPISKVPGVRVEDRAESGPVCKSVDHAHLLFNERQSTHQIRDGRGSLRRLICDAFRARSGIKLKASTLAASIHSVSNRLASRLPLQVQEQLGDIYR